MVMFSQLRRCDLTDEQGRQARLVDLGVALLDADYAGELKNTRRNNVLAFATLVLITTAVVVMLGSQLLEMFGVGA